MKDYFSQYNYIYKELIASNFIDPPYNILSIGSECGEDYLGIYYALNLQDIDASNLINYSFLKPDVMNCNIFSNQFYNIIIFPDSLGNFNNNYYRNLISIFKHTKFKSEKIVIISCFEKECSCMDFNRLEIISDIFSEKHDYKLDIEKSHYFLSLKNTNIDIKYAIKYLSYS